MLTSTEIRNIMVTLIVTVPLAILLLFFVFSTISVNGEPDPGGMEVIIDGDPGADDAMAILMMLSSCSKANLLAITTTAGNTGVGNTTRNAHLILQVANRSDIPVYSGSDQGLVFPAESDNFFGYDGLGDVFSSEPMTESEDFIHAAVAMADFVKRKPGQVIVLVTGPLTNIALALHLNPNFLNQVKEIIILGGSYQGGGNKKPGVEFNMYADPDSASFVFAHVPLDKPITVIPIETVHGISITMEWRRSVLGALGTSFMNFLNEAERIVMPKYKMWFPFDQTAAATILEPAIISSSKEAFIRVETCGNLARGAFLRDDKSSKSNVRFITGINDTIFKDVLLKYMNSTSTMCL